MLQVVESPREQVRLLRSRRILVVAKTLQMAWDLAMRLEENGYPAVLVPFRKIASVDQSASPPAMIVLTSELTPENMATVYRFLRRSARFAKVPIIAVAPVGQGKVEFPVEFQMPGSSSTTDVLRHVIDLMQAIELGQGPQAA